MNSSTIGICLIHLDTPYTSAQLNPLKVFVSGLMELYGINIKNVKGHYEVDKRKPDCPDINMDWLREAILEEYRNKEFSKQFASNVIRGLQ
jgi:N-acetyl-anhydromuramyl-L-alanine amidase AmpD